jgi:serine/threonine protein kinase
MTTIPEQLAQEGTLPITRPPAWTTVGDTPIPARIGDFEILSKLGQGAFGQVFLARQVSLGRNVALKVVEGEFSGRSEGQLLAGLEHDHIVKVYSAFADSETGKQGLCLQYVPGADLGVIIRHIYSGRDAPTNGNSILSALDELRRNDTGFDPGALRDRESLASDNFPQAVCRIGMRLAEALAFAHARGILHCDIKPGNILITPYGRPMLADFNVAFDRKRHKPEDTHYGGTLAYMAPEYHAAMLNQPGGSADERCDIYSLGVVLYELATGTRPTRLQQSSETQETALPGSNAIPKLTNFDLSALSQVPRELATVIRHALHTDPAQRYQTATELANALSGAWQLLAARRALPAPSPVGRWVNAHPVRALVIAGGLPHIVASLVQIGYNAVEIQLNAAQGNVFAMFVVIYNLIAYPVCGGIGLWYMWRITRRFTDIAQLPSAELDSLRNDVRRLCRVVAGLGALGWLPGGLLFPLVIDAFAGPLPWQTYAHYLVSFTLAGLIGVVFSYLGNAYVVFRTLLPQLGNPDTHKPAVVAEDVRTITAPFGTLVMLACGIPLIGAVLLLTLADSAFTLGFRVLIVGLIGAGVASVGLAERIVRRLRELAAVWQKDSADLR